MSFAQKHDRLSSLLTKTSKEEAPGKQEVRAACPKDKLEVKCLFCLFVFFQAPCSMLKS